MGLIVAQISSETVPELVLEISVELVPTKNEFQDCIHNGIANANINGMILAKLDDDDNVIH